MSAAAPHLGSSTAGDAVETPLWLSVGSESVFTILTEPAEATEPTGAGVVLLHSGVYTMTAHSGRIWARTASTLAARGCSTMRVDLTGSGESSGVFQRRGSGQPVEDTSAAITELERRGVTRVVAVGHCFGAVPAMMAALEHPCVRGLVLVAPPLTWVKPGQTTLQGGGPAPLAQAARSIMSAAVLRRVLTDPAYRGWLLRRAYRRGRRASLDGSRQEPPRTILGLEPLRTLTDRGVKIKILYGADDALYRDFQRSLDDELGPIIRRPSVEMDVQPGQLHNLDRLAVQDYLRQVIEASAGDLLTPA